MTGRGNILVTGGAGYIGSHACKVLKRAGYTPVTLDNFSTGWRHAVKFGPLGEADLLDRAALPDHVHAVYIRQRAPLGLGHAVACTRPALGDEPFAVLLADDFIIPASGAANPTAALSAGYAASGRSQLLLQNVLPTETHKYGIAIPGDDSEGIAGLVEKPAPGQSPSTLASIGRYVFHPEIFNVLARRERMGALPLDGVRHDCGTHLGYLGAIVAA